MSKLDFSTVINRRGTDSYKWDAADREVGNTETIQMGCADMDFKSPPEIIEELHKVVEHGIFGYATLTQQYAPSIVSWYKERHNCELKPEWILYVPRIVVACSVLVNTFTQKGDKVILNSPYYPPLNDVTSGCYREVICPALVEKDGRYVMDLEALEKQIDASTKLMILVSPHNPTTRIWTREELQAIADFCVKHDLLLFVDEIHSDFAAKGQTFISMADIQGPIQDRLVVVNAPAKSFNVMGCAMSYLIVPNAEVRKRLEKALDAAGETDANDFGNAVMRVAYQKCGYYVDEVNAYIDDNDAYLREAALRCACDQRQGIILVCHYDNGRPVRSYRRAWETACRRAGVSMRFYDVRHIAATVMLGEGADLAAVAAQLGHQSVATTGAIYAHVTPTGQAHAAELMPSLGEVIDVSPIKK